MPNAFNPCLIIPIFNHSEEFARVLPRFRALGLPALLIDDGSSPAQRSGLQQLIENESWLEMTSHPHNLGKGRAVASGLLRAQALGYSHAFQIDADGQHGLDAVPNFLHEAENHPEALVTAVRSYSNAPKGRVYGRKITDFWVWVNTLSTHIQDSMCGFRIYPVALTLKSLSPEKFRSRMDFDTDILVRLYWQGIEIRQLETAVNYDATIRSHFKMWRDNCRISLMHTLLFFGMLPRIPTLLKLRRRYRHAKS